MKPLAWTTLIASAGVLWGASSASATLQAGEPEAVKVADLALPISVSPDGRRILAFGPGASLALFDVRSGETRPLTKPSLPQLAMNGVFSPTGNHVAYSWHNEDDFDELRIVDIEGGNVIARYRDPTVRSIWVKDWSADRERILAVLLRYDASIQIVSVPAWGGPPRVLAVLDSLTGAFPGRMAWSPDGERIAYDAAPRHGSLAHDLFVMADDGSGRSSIVEHPSDDRLIGWTLDGDGILFASDRAGTVDVWHVSPDDPTDPRRVREDVGRMLPLGTTGDGGYYYGTSHCDCHLYISELDPETGHLIGSPEIVGPALHNSGGDWSPDGGFIAYIAPATGVVPASTGVARAAWTLRVRSRETGSERIHHPAIDRLHQLRPRWSPDGRLILLKGWDRNAYPRVVAYALDVETGDYTTVLSEASLWRRMVDWVGWYGERTAVSYVDQTADQTTGIVVRDMREDEERTVFRAPVPPYLYGLTASPDGRHLAFGLWDTRARTSSLASVSASTGEPRVLVELSLPAAVSPPAWYPNSVDLMYEAEDRLWRVSTEGGAPESLGTYEPLESNQAGISIHPDRTHVAFVAEKERTSAVWFIPRLLSTEHEERGSWGPVLELPTHPEQMAVLPSGKVLMWPWAPDRKTPPHGPLALWDPADGRSIIYPGSGIESASGLAFQPDGVLLSAGGDMPRGGVDGNPRSFTFDYATETLSEVAGMAAGRVFPSATTLGTGEILVTAGLDADKEVNGVPELWNGERWTPLPEAFNDESRGPTFQFLAPDGRLFRAGPEELTDWLDVGTGTWSDVDPEHRNEVRYQGTAVMYEEGKILLAGGCPVGPEEGWYEQCRDTVLATAEVIDLQDPSPAWRAVSPMAFPRHSHHATLLPDGTVLVTGGTDRPGIFNDEADGILEAELWDPTTETFTPVAPMDAPRHFQSAAVLLPDGRVLVAGGAFGPSDEEARFSSSGQIFSPPYLERGPRPTIARAPSAVGYGRDFGVETRDAREISRVTLVRLSATSQTWNGGQRLARLSFVADSDGLRVEGPRDRNIVPPGFYLLFILDDRGVPSVGHVLRVGHDNGSPS